MSYTPAVNAINLQQAGNQNFPWVSGWNDAIVLVANTAQSINLATVRTNMGLASTVPLFAVFSATGGFWADFHQTAVIPAASTNNGTCAEYNPSQRYLDETITAISFISTGTPIISIQFYRP